MAYHRKNQVSGSAAGSASGSSSSSWVQFQNPSFGDTTDTKLFVGGLPWETDREALHRHFEHFGEIQEAVVIIDNNTGKSKGYGFVTFVDRESAARACADPTPVIDGRKANCNLASRGRPQIDSAYTRPKSAGSFYGVQDLPGSAEFGNSSLYYYPPIIYDYQQGIAYPTYGYAGYGPEYIYPQNIYSNTSSSGGQYLQMQRFPGSILNPSSVYPYGQFGQRLPSGYDCSSSYQSYEIPAQRFLQFRGTKLNGVVTAGTTPAAIQSPYPPAARVPSQPQSIRIHARSPRFTRDSGVSNHQMAV